jgi:hypothetical protein
MQQGMSAQFDNEFVIVTKLKDKHCWLIKSRAASQRLH